MSRGSLHSLKAIAENGTMSNGQQSLSNVFDRYNTPKHVLYLQFVRKNYGYQTSKMLSTKKAAWSHALVIANTVFFHVVDALGLDFNVSSAFCGQFGNVG